MARKLKGTRSQRDAIHDAPSTAKPGTGIETYRYEYELLDYDLLLEIQKSIAKVLSALSSDKYILKGMKPCVIIHFLDQILNYSLNNAIQRPISVSIYMGNKLNVFNILKTEFIYQLTAPFLPTAE